MLKRIPPPTTRIQSSIPNCSAPNRDLQFRHSCTMPRSLQHFSPVYVFSPSDMTQYCWNIGQGTAIPHPKPPVKIVLSTS